MISSEKVRKRESSMKKRESFNSRWGFILACIGSAVGMGNIWMFPTRVSLYGGGSFLIPYFLFVARIGVKVWIYRGEVLKGEVAASDKRESNDRRRQNRNGKRDFNKAKKEGGNK
jgi:SNF family Na+-dependent transporter